jgi:hypothetical protein
LVQKYGKIVQLISPSGTSVRKYSDSFVSRINFFGDPMMQMLKIFGIALVLTLILVVGGCQDNSTTPAVPHSTAGEVSAVAPGTGKTVVILPDSLLGVDTKLILPLVGGSLNVRTCSFQVPAGALLTPLMLSFELVSNQPPKGLNDPSERIFKFGPDATTFVKTCILTVPFNELGLNQKDPSKYACYYYNVARRRYEIQPTSVDLVNRRYQVKVKHFSQYAFGRVDE